jgi:hypothetical protein
MLLYPKPGTNQPKSVGTCDVFEKIDIGDRLVFGATVETRGISSPNGLRSFSLAVANAFPPNDWSENENAFLAFLHETA